MSDALAILPGSYDPITKGHVALIERAARIFPRVVVAVMHNEQKTTLFNADQRKKLAEVSLAHLENCEVIVDDGLLIDLYRRLGASCVVKGLRNAEDLAYETVQANWNRAHLPGFETLYLPAEEDLRAVSSTEVRRRMDVGEPLSMLLMPEAERLITSGEIRSYGTL